MNPAAKSERAKQFVKKVQQISRGAIIKFTEGPGDAEAKAERAVQQGFQTIVAAGGDGTINEVVNGLEDAPVHLGILPIGSVNVFAMELGIPSNIDAAWKIIQGGKIRLIDQAMANGHRFVQLAGVGLDAEIVERTDWNSKKMLGPLSYVLTATQVIHQKPPKLRILADDDKVYRGSFVLLGNGRYYGGPFEIFKDAKLDDGLLDVCVFEQMSPLALIRYLQGIMTGSHTRFDDVKHFKARRILIDSDDRVPVEVDGELLGELPLRISGQ